MKDVCILISTCESYRPIAEWTAGCIAHEWKNHPPIRYAGLEDSRDWISVNLDGVDRAIAEGFRWIYLILDDHPPVGRCRDDILNDVLPNLGRKYSAVNINLLGFGQRRGSEGVIARDSGGLLLRNELDYRWKFSLHPALWSAYALRDLLILRREQFAENERTPWNFERHRDAIGGFIPAHLLHNTYRVNGNSAACGSRFFDVIWRETLLLAIDVKRFFIRILRGQAARDVYDRDNLWAYHYYRGPYPILWSGTMRKGSPSPDFENFCRYTRRMKLLRGWNMVKKQLGPAAKC